MANVAARSNRRRSRWIGSLACYFADPMRSVTSTTIALAVTGSIAAYKSAELARELVKRGVRVLPIMSRGAERFLGAATLSGITGEPVSSDMWDPRAAGEIHVAISAAADALVIAPATADVIARLASGRADDLVTAVALCARGPVLVAPSMHPRMWGHPATQANVAELTRQGRVQLVGPVFGEVASGDEGVGRMSEPREIADAIVAALAPKDLANRRVLVTAGPTVEDIDPVRFLGNRSTGKMGFAIAARAAARGADVTLIAGPVALQTPYGVRRVDVRSAREMSDAVAACVSSDLSGVDAVIMAAAVADYRVEKLATEKIKKSGDSWSISLVRNPDIIGDLGAARNGISPVLVAFALETCVGDQLEIEGRRKLNAKRVDVVVANQAADALGTDQTSAVLVFASSCAQVPRVDKRALADAILDAVASRLA